MLPALEKRLLGIVSFAALAIVLAVSCSESQPPPTSMNASTDFPNSVGSVWVYAAFDSISGAVDTVTVEVVGTIRLASGERAAVWKHQKSDSAWYRYIVTRGRRVVEYPEIVGGSANLMYVFPLKVGSQWVSNPAWADTSRIVEKDSLAHPACTLGSAYYVQRSWAGGASYGFADTWLVPKIGIIRSNLFSANSVDTTRETWELISCSLVEEIDSTKAENIEKD